MSHCPGLSTECLICEKEKGFELSLRHIDVFDWSCQMLKVRIFDVDHGFCAAVQAGDRQILIDCGYHSCRGFHPTQYLQNQAIRRLDYLVMPTFVEGSLAGFSELIGYSLSHCLKIDYLLGNPSIDEESLAELLVRNFRTQKALNFLRDVCQRFSSVERTIQLEEVQLSFFWNTYPEFLDFSNLSLVTFVSFEGGCILFPGNLKTPGWQMLLRNARFRDQLGRVNVLVASNYGRQDGYCAAIFDYCQPDLVIISGCDLDQPSLIILRQYERQMQKFHRMGIGKSRVLITRKVGMITIHQTMDRLVQVISEWASPYQLHPAEIYQI